MSRRSPHRTLFFLSASLVFLIVAADPAQAAGAAATAHKAFLWRPFLAPFHAVLLHFPIGFVTMVCVLELYRLRRPNADLKPVTTLTLWLSLLSGVVAASLGILRATSGGYEVHELETHRWTGISVVAATLLALALQSRAYRDEKRRALTVAYRAALAATLGLLVVAGHMGGNLTHGSKYLTENAPSFVRDWIEEKAPQISDASVSTNPDEKQRFYVEQVQPILEKKCLRCHGPEKQKGDYRLDRSESALAGGESGKAAIKPGDPLGSELVRLILLPPGDDDIMPPDGKEPVNADEAMTIIRWIQKGALFPAPVTASAVRGTGGQ
jgi:uncharacterized membrane protein